MNCKELEKLVCDVLRLRLGDAKLAMTGNKVALVERLYLHHQDPSSKPEPEHEDVPDATPESEDSSESSSEGATTESTPYIFNQLASALHWIMATNYAADLIHYLDDFLLAGPPGQPTCSESTETMLRVCERLGIPVALNKLEVDINLALRAALASCISFLVSEYVLLVAVVALTEFRTSERSTSRSPASTNQGIECSMPAAHLKPKRQPITNEMLGQMLSQLDRDHKPSHDRSVLKATITLGFFGLLRFSELTVPNQHGFNPDQHLNAKDITMRKDSMVVVIKKSKTDQRGENYLINIGTALTSRALRLILHHLIRTCGYSTKLYHTHSLRIGAATAVSKSGLSPATIKNLGRWWSEAYKVYTVTL
ncbi:hypothetical protein EMCRGX_G004995 [Ephydatia muelleri]